MAFEHVYTVWDYYDGPRSGIAAYSGEPHHYDCEWNDAKSDYSETFILTPIDTETLTLAMEQELIWREWEAAFHLGSVPQSTHPGLPGSHPRYAELEATLKARISALLVPHKRANAVFRAKEGQADAPSGVLRELEVEWTDIGR
jgi:hypothetical protein